MTERLLLCTVGATAICWASVRAGAELLSASPAQWSSVEGALQVDFLDAAARAVIIVGLPFPPLYETTVRLKREFNSEHAAVLGTGDYW